VRALEHAAAAGWPLALTAVAILARERVRAGRRRGALNRALHELRRPLQALALVGRPGESDGRPRNRNGVPGRVDLALAALDELDRAINGGPSPLRLRPVVCRPWVEGSLGRWRVAAGRAGSPVELRWRAGSATVLADPRRLAQALDNLIVNAIEHGGPPVRVEGAVSGGRLRIAVLDGGRSASGAEAYGPSAPPTRLSALVRRLRTRGRRGHGLDVVARIAAEHGGRFLVRHHDRGTAAVLELPLAGIPAQAVARATAV
jgi:signal transduction histidine kinase